MHDVHALQPAYLILGVHPRIYSTCHIKLGRLVWLPADRIGFYLSAWLPGLPGLLLLMTIFGGALDLIL